MAGNRPKKVEQPKTFDQATALFHRASQLKREIEQKQTSTGSAYGDTKRANYQREAPIRQERWGNRVVKPETQNAQARKQKATQKTAQNTKPKANDNSVANGAVGGSTTKAKIQRVFASEAEAAARGASGGPLRTKEEKGRYVSGADYKAYKTAQDKARQANKPESYKERKTREDRERLAKKNGK